MIALTNKLPKIDDKDLNLSTIRYFFDRVAEETSFPKYDNFVISSDNYDDEMAKVYKNLHEGGKSFVISTYQTVGSGIQTLVKL